MSNSTKKNYIFLKKKINIFQKDQYFSKILTFLKNIDFFLKKKVSFFCHRFPPGRNMVADNRELLKRVESKIVAMHFDS